MDGTTADHNYNWWDSIKNPNSPCPGGVPSSPEPCDDDSVIGNGHGSHTMGTMVGNDGGENVTGMAPGAKWIACRNMNNGVGVVPTYMECMQWFIRPTKLDGTGGDTTKRPHVTNNSWGCIEACPPPALKDTLKASRAAGIVYVVSAGNDGPACDTIYHPLARYPQAFTVGMTAKAADTIDSRSSRGPTLGDEEVPVQIKPNISAPGRDIRAPLRASDTSYGNLSGTSMAGPHVAGLVALVISAKPSLEGKVDQIENIIKQSAVKLPPTPYQGVQCGSDTSTSVPNNIFGWGRIDALAAVNMALGPTAVALGPFTAAPQRGSVTLRWRAYSETRHIGYNVWRSEKANGRYQKLNRTLIDVKRSTGGSSYRYVDRTGGRRNGYFYKLQAVGIDASVWAGPVRAQR